MKGARPLSQNEIASILDAIASGRHPRRDRCLFLMGIRTGFRISELLSLQFKDVWKDGQVVHEITVSKAHMKKKVESRTVPLHPEAREALENHVVDIQKSPLFRPELPLFPSQRGASLDRKSAWEMLQRICKKASVCGYHGTHALRKTFAKRMYEAFGHDLLKTQEAMGHKNLSSTAAYIQVNQSEIREAILK